MRKNSLPNFLKASAILGLVLIFGLMVGTTSLTPVAVAQEEQITLEIWDNHNSETRNPIVEAAIEKLKERHPNVKVKRTSRPLADIKSQIMPAVADEGGPDVMTVNAGEQMMGPLVRGDHIVNLDPYAEEYGWTEKLYSPSLWNRARYSEDGSTIGTGNLYGVGFDGEMVGVYYNKEIFEKHDLEIPESISEFEQVLSKLEKAGVEPISLAGLKDYRIFHVYTLVQASVMSHYVGPGATQDYLDSMVLEWEEDVTWVNAANEEAARIMREWAEKGYFIEGYSGLGGTDDLEIFKAGEAAMFIQGSWYSADIANSDVEAGFFPFPPYEKDETLPPQLGGMTTPTGINAHSENKDLAAEFLDILITSDKTVELQKEMSILPARVPASLEGVEEDTLYYDLLKTWNRVHEAGHVAHYLDWATPTMYDTLAEAGRKLLSGSMTPEEFLETIEADYRDWMEEKPSA
jgi:raffinose/stachyose/melibiose transport system substrate-binding protein